MGPRLAVKRRRVLAALFGLVELVERLVCPWYALSRERQEPAEDLEDAPGEARAPAS